MSDNTACPWCGSGPATCEHCGGSIPGSEIEEKPTEEVVEEEVQEEDVQDEDSEEDEGANGIDDGSGCLVTFFLVGLLIIMLLAGYAIFRDEIDGVREQIFPSFSVPENVTVFTPDYILENNIPSLLPKVVICPNGVATDHIVGLETCDFSDTHDSSLAGGRLNTNMPEASSDNFVWAYNLPDLRATRVAQVPWGTSFRWQGCYGVDSGSERGDGIFHWTFVYGYGWIDAYQVIGGCQHK